MIAALLFALSAPVPDASAFQHLLDRNLPANLAPTAIESKLKPALARAYPGSEWEGCKATLGAPGAIVQAWLHPRTPDHFGAVGAVIWRSHGRVRGQVVQFLDDNEVDPDQGFVYCGEAYLLRNRLIWVGDAESMGNWTVPAVLMYSDSRDGWRPVARTVGDRMTGYPGTRFARTAGRPDARRIAVTMRDYPKFIDQPHAGPLLQFTATWTVRGTHVMKGKARRTPTALAELDDLAGLARHGKWEAFNARVPARCRAEARELLGHEVHVNCEDRDNPDTAADLFTEGQPEGKPSFTFHFVRRGSGWRLASLETMRGP